MDLPLEVRRCGVDLSWEVRSEADASRIYVVTLNDPQFSRGHCTCDDFKFRIEHYIEHGEPPERWTCKHIDAVILSIYDSYQGHRLRGERLGRFRVSNS